MEVGVEKKNKGSEANEIHACSLGLNPGGNNNFEVDPISSRVATSLDMKAEEIKAEEREKEAQRKEALQRLKTTIVISAVAVAVAGAVFAVIKKLRET